MIKMNGQPFSGVTYNQGAFAGNRGHLFIKGIQQCSYALSIKSRNRIWNSITQIAKLEQTIADGNICEQCAKNTTELIKKHKEGK